MNENIIEIKNLHKSFKIVHEQKKTIFNMLFSFKQKNEKLEVLKNINIQVKKGEILGVLGRNGAGKTTLLQLMARILNPNSGKIIIKGKVAPFLSIGIGFNPELTAKENIIFYGIIMGFSKKEISRRVKTVLEFAELEKFHDTKLAFPQEL